MLPEKDCTGCGACIGVCPEKCIKPIKGANGFTYPKIDKTACLNCGLCEKICPIRKNPIDFSPKHASSYAAIIKNGDIRKNSSSGGMFSALAQCVINRGGIVYGAAFSDDFTVEHTGVTDISLLDKLRRSKYVQSDLKNCFGEIKAHLESGTEVLFCSTPCHCAGLVAFLKKSYENLLTVDFVCHGVPSPEVFAEYLKYRENEYNSKIVDINFRDKSCGWQNYCVKLTFENGEVYKKCFSEDPYMRAFLSNLSLRPSCYTCKFKSPNRCSDITLADFWGVDEIAPSLNDGKGLSLVTVQTEKGEKYLNDVKHTLTITPTDIDKIYPYNPCIIKAVDEPPFGRYFFSRLGKTPFPQLVEKCLRPSYTARLGRKLLILKNRNKGDDI